MGVAWKCGPPGSWPCRWYRGADCRPCRPTGRRSHSAPGMPGSSRPLETSGDRKRRFGETRPKADSPGKTNGTVSRLPHRLTSRCGETTRLGYTPTLVYVGCDNLFREKSPPNADTIAPIVRKRRVKGQKVRGKKWKNAEMLGHGR